MLSIRTGEGGKGYMVSARKLSYLQLGPLGS